MEVAAAKVGVKMCSNMIRKILDIANSDDIVLERIIKRRERIDETYEKIENSKYFKKYYKIKYKLYTFVYNETRLPYDKYQASFHISFRKKSVSGCYDVIYSLKALNRDIDSFESFLRIIEFFTLHPKIIVGKTFPTYIFKLDYVNYNFTKEYNNEHKFLCMDIAKLLLKDKLFHYPVNASDIIHSEPKNANNRQTLRSYSDLNNSYVYNLDEKKLVNTEQRMQIGSYFNYNDNLQREIFGDTVNQNNITIPLAEWVMLHKEDHLFNVHGCCNDIEFLELRFDISIADLIF